MNTNSNSEIQKLTETVAALTAKVGQLEAALCGLSAKCDALTCVQAQPSAPTVPAGPLSDDEQKAAMFEATKAMFAKAAVKTVPKSVAALEMAGVVAGLPENVTKALGVWAECYDNKMSAPWVRIFSADPETGAPRKMISIKKLEFDFLVRVRNPDGSGLVEDTVPINGLGNAILKAMA